MRFLLLFLCIYAISAPCPGAIIGYGFTGVVTTANANAPPYGLLIPAFAPVTGQFFYEAGTSPASLGDSSIYRQNLLAGFTASFGTVQVAASSYDIIVSNNMAQPDGTTVDVMSIIFSNTLTPPPDSPLVVQAMPQSVGQLSLNLVAPSNVFVDTALPTTLELSSFTSRIGFFADTPPGIGTIDVIFLITALAPIPVPEPAGITSFLIGVAFLLAARRLA